MTLWAKKFSWFCQNCILLFRGISLLFLARFFKHGLPKLYSTCPEALFAELFSQNQNNWHCERKKNQLVLTDLLSFFPGNFWAKNSRFLVLARFFKHGLPKLYSTCPEALFAEFFSQNHINWHCERKNSAAFVPTAFYFSWNIWAKKVVLLDFFLVPARFFKRGLPKLYSMCPEALFAEFFSKNHIIWHCERKISAGFVRTAFYFSEELSSKTVLLYYSLPDSSSMVAKTVFYVSRGNFCGILFTESY